MSENAELKLDNSFYETETGKNALLLGPSTDLAEEIGPN
jgi:hypothetical protein